MRTTSLLNTSKKCTLFSGNEKVVNKRSVVYGHTTYDWNTRFIALMDAFFAGKSVHNLTDRPSDFICKYVAAANGTLDPLDEDYQLVCDFNNHLATIH